MEANFAKVVPNSPEENKCDALATDPTTVHVAQLRRPCIAPTDDLNVTSPNNNESISSAMLLVALPTVRAARSLFASKILSGSSAEFSVYSLPCVAEFVLTLSLFCFSVARYGWIASVSGSWKQSPLILPALLNMMFMIFFNLALLDTSPVMTTAIIQLGPAIAMAMEVIMGLRPSGVEVATIIGAVMAILGFVLRDGTGDGSLRGILFAFVSSFASATGFVVLGFSKRAYYDEPSTKGKLDLCVMLHILVIHEGQRCLFGVLFFLAFDWSFVTQNGPFFGWTWEPLLVSFAWAASVGVTMISVVKFGGIVANMAISLEITVTYIGAAAFLGSPVRVYELFQLMSLVSTVVAYNYLGNGTIWG